MSLLYAFLFSISILFYVNWLWISNTTKCEPKIEEERKGWFDLLKNGLILLGTALTTVIGYYFGQREGSIKAAEAQKDAERTDSTAKHIVDLATKQRDESVLTSVRIDSDPEITDTPTRNED